MIHTIAFRILPCFQSNDHQVRILIDGDDWLDASPLGLDPPEFFSQPALRSSGELIVGRCDCGVLGCGDTTVDVSRELGLVKWTNANGLDLAFSEIEFDLAISFASNDFTWEDCNRESERLAGQILSGLEFDGYRFQWASTRIKKNTLTLSFTRRDQQQLIDLPWDGASSKNAVEVSQRFRNSRTNQAMHPSRGSADL